MGIFTFIVTVVSKQKYSTTTTLSRKKLAHSEYSFNGSTLTLYATENADYSNYNYRLGYFSTSTGKATSSGWVRGNQASNGGVVYSVTISAMPDKAINLWSHRRDDGHEESYPVSNTSASSSSWNPV